MSHEFAVGVEGCCADRPDWLRRARFGLLMNRSSVDRDLRFSCDLLADAFPGQLASIFTPQHGLWGDAQANMDETDHGMHRRLGIPVHSLYSEVRRPTSEMLSNIDRLVIDLQDVGTRVYTFIWTMRECLHACAEAGVGVTILDRPNPIGGHMIEGPMLSEACRSFVGGWTIPMRHGLTMGELARLLKKEEGIDVEMNVVKMRGWASRHTFDALDRRWLPPSPNLPTFASAQVYPGQVLLEGTNLSEGRGTTTPFEVIGAPYIDADALVEQLSAFRLQGVKFLPICFRPTFDKWHGQACNGVSIHVTDADQFRSFDMTVRMLDIVSRNWGEHFRWIEPPYEYESEKPPIDIIYGSDKLRTKLGRQEDVNGLVAVDVDAWLQRCEDSRLY